MSNKRSVIKKLITPGFRLMSPIPPFELKVVSPTGVINRNMGGIGLGIVAALENVPEKKADDSCRNRMRSDLVPVPRSKTGDKVCSLEEDYGTVVTSNKLNKSVARSRGKGCIFNISPSRFGDDDMRVTQPAGFLDSCHLCNKRLHGKDIYMYRGEKAFCSVECRSRRIAMDERPDKYCSSQASSSGASRVMATGIFAI